MRPGPGYDRPNIRIFTIPHIMSLSVPINIWKGRSEDSIVIHGYFGLPSILVDQERSKCTQWLVF
jgi:hypothetical protein